jgi:hypothetical protein
LKYEGWHVNYLEPQKPKNIHLTYDHDQETFLSYLSESENHFYYLQYTAAKGDGIDRLTTLKNTFNSTAIYSTIDLAMLSDKRTYWEYSRFDVAQRIGGLIVFFLPFVLFLQHFDPLAFMLSFNDVMKT